MTKKLFSLLMSFSALVLFAQEKTARNKPQFLDEDLKYEIAHKSQPWYSNMKNGSDYFEIKKQFDTYFGNHLWEKSKPRALGESWIKEKIFYLDKTGKVQSEPKLETSPTVSLNNSASTASSTTSLGSWSLLGPVNSASTIYSSGRNHGGYVFLNRIDPTNNQKMFLSFLTGGLWMTIDGGTNWTLADTNLPDACYNDLDIAISNPQIIYAISKKQVVKSIDGGANWLPTTMISTSYTGDFYDIAVSTSNPNIVIARIGSTIYRTIDGGITWTSVLADLRNHEVWDSSIHSEMIEWSANLPNVVYSVSTYNDNEVLVHLSTDSGATFTLVSTLTLDAGANGQIVGWAKIFTPTSDVNNIYVAVGSGGTPYGHHSAHLYKLGALTGIQQSVRTNMVSGTSPNEVHHGDLSMDRNDHNKIVYGTYGQTKIYVSTDNGVSFTASAAGTHSDIRSIDIIGSKISVGSDGEMALSTDNGATMPTMTNSISNHELWGFGSAFKTDVVASGNNHGPVMIKESGNGFDWYNGTGADQGNTDVNPLDDRYIYSQGYSNYRYFRTGVHTLENQSNFLDVGGIYSYFNSIEFHPNKYYTIITHHAGSYPTGNANLATWKKSLIKTDDNGNSISIVKTFTDQVFREKISMKNPNHMYVVEGLTNNKLWHTTNAGVTWVDITPSSVATSGETNISDIAVGDENPNEIWVTYSGVQSVCKIIKSSDYGLTWTNLTQPILTDYPLTKIIFQRGSNGGVYVGNKSGVYYRNKTMTNWVLLGNGLPLTDIRFMFINYNQGKLKIGTSRGAFTHNLYETSPVNALISASKTKITCPYSEKVQFKDYSVVRNATATWAWSFPGATPATSTLENPEVSYIGAANGFYNVTLTVTDATGTSTQTLTNFIEIANVCGNSVAESIPGNVTKLTGATNNDYLELKDLNLNKNSFTFSCWIKPNGIQEDYSGVFMTQSGNAFGMNFMGGNNTIGFHPAWSWNSNLIAPANQWSHVALVSNGTDVKIYVNGIESTNSTAMTSEVFAALDLGRYGNSRGDRYAKFEMDEVCLWNRALTKDEIRQWRHLTKSTAGSSILTGLIGYYQFNETSGDLSISKTTTSNALTYKGTTASNRTVSNAPVFGGFSEKKTISSSGVFDFNDSKTSMTFSNSIDNPLGDVWVSNSNIKPDVLPDSNTQFDSYTVVNNYGINASFYSLTELKFAHANYTSTSANKYNLYKRDSNAFGNTWGSILDKGDAITTISGPKTQVAFTAIGGLVLNNFSQFILTNTGETLSLKTNIDTITPKIYPNPIKNGSPFNISIPENWEQTTMSIYDNLGKNIGQVLLKSGVNQVILNCTAGMYHLTFLNQKINQSQKVLILE